MARIPTDDISEITTTQRLPFQNISVSPDTFGAAVGRGLGEASDAAFAIHQREQALTNETEARAADNELAKDLTNYEFDPQTGFRTRQGKNAVDAYATVPQDLDSMYQTRRAALSNDTARRIFDNAALHRVEYTRRSLGSFTQTENQQWQIGTSKARIDSLVHTASMYANDSELFQQTLNAAGAEVDNQAFLQGFGKDSDWANNQKIATAQGAWTARIERKLLDDPQGALNWIQGDGTPDSEALRATMEPDKLLTLQTHAEAILHRNDALADRTEDAAYRQIESGIPTAAEDRVKREGILLGAGRADIVKELNDEENSVQGILHSPVQQQIDAVSQRQAEFLKTGGTIKEQARLDRLRKAVNANIDLIQEKPYDYAAYRLNLPTTPIDVAGFSDPTQLGTLHQQLAQRASVLDSVYRATGIAPKNHGLLQPQEALQLANNLQSVDAQHQPQVLKGLYQSIGDPVRFRDTLQQVFPGNDPLAVAGMRAAQGGSVEVAAGPLQFSGTFPFVEQAPAKTVSADEAAGLIAWGRKLLNPTEAERKEKGDRASIPLPNDSGSTGLRVTFSNFTGSAFAGDPKAEQLAYETFRAAYAGLAAKDGDYAGEDSTTKGARMKTALAISVGTVKKYTDGSAAVAPWGLSEAEFTDQSQQKVAEAVHQLNLPPRLETEFNNGDIGLTPAGFNKYWLVKGGKTIPVQIDFNNRGSLAVPNLKGMLDNFLNIFGSDDKPAEPAEPTLAEATPAAPPPTTPAPVPAPVPPKGPTDGQIEQTAQTRPASGLQRSRTEDFPVGNTMLERMPLIQRRSLPHNAPVLDDFATAVEHALKLPPDMLLAIKNAGERSESVGKNSVSSEGARGVMQFIGPTAKAYGLADPTDPLASIKAAGRYMREALQMYDGNVRAAIAEYNGGPKQARAVLAGKEPPAEETRKYVARVMAFLSNQDVAKS